MGDGGESFFGQSVAVLVAQSQVVFKDVIGLPLVGATGSNVMVAAVISHGTIVAQRQGVFVVLLIPDPLDPFGHLAIPV